MSRNTPVVKDGVDIDYSNTALFPVYPEVWQDLISVATAVMAWSGRLGDPNADQQPTGFQFGAVPVPEGLASQTLDGRASTNQPLGKVAEHAELPPTVGLISTPGLSNVSVLSDYVTTLREVPLTVDPTQLIADWHVHADAGEGRDDHVEQLIGLWDVTNKEDIVLAERIARCELVCVRARPQQPAVGRTDLRGAGAVQAAIGSPSPQRRRPSRLRFRCCSHRDYRSFLGRSSSRVGSRKRDHSVACIVFIEFPLDIGEYYKAAKAIDFDWTAVDAAEQKAGVRHLQQITQPGRFIDIDEFPSRQAYDAYQKVAGAAIREYESLLGVTSTVEIWDVADRRGA